MMGIKKKTFNVLFKKASFSYGLQIILHFSNKDFGTPTAADSPFAGSIRLKRQACQGASYLFTFV